MRRLPFLVTAAAAIGVLGAQGARAAGTVEVSFVKPEQFADVRDAAFRRDDNLATLKRHIETAAAPYVADGQTLKVEVLDVDLAGEPSHRVRLNDVRVLKGRADWPRITLRYSLDAPGQTTRSREATVSDMAYLQRINNYAREDALPYERRMLEDWFKAEFKR